MSKLFLVGVIAYLLFVFWDRRNQARGIANFQRRVFRSTMTDETTERLLKTALILMITMGLLALLGLIPSR